jgi:hypothetical protein
MQDGQGFEAHRVLQFMSHAWVSHGEMYIVARTVLNDPTSVKTFKFENGRLMER